MNATMKISLFLLLIIYCCLLVVLSSEGWMFSKLVTEIKDNNEENGDKSSSTAQNKRRRTPFEIKTMDDRFISETAMSRDLSPLDACHNRVVAELEGTCGDMLEEDLAKLSVRLLNCQLEAEKRRIYLCTSDMTIARCTSDMDPTTWNAYQIVSNRARAICYAVRQQQFRLNSELTVNRLFESSQQQLQTLDMLYEGQEQIKLIAQDTVKQLEEGHQSSIENHAELKRLHSDVRVQLIGNLHELRQERKLITVGNKQLMDMTDEVRQKLDQTSEQIMHQSAMHGAQHQNLLDDLANLGTLAVDVSSKLDKNAAAVESFQRSIISHQETALNNLKRINMTVNYLLYLTDSLYELIDTKLHWLIQVSNTTESKFSVIGSMALHFFYFLAWLSFFVVLRLRLLARCLLLCAVCLNATMEIKHGDCLSFAELAVAISILVISELVFPNVRKMCKYLKFQRSRNACKKKDSLLTGLTHMDSQDVSKLLKSLTASHCDEQSPSLKILKDSILSGSSTVIGSITQNQPDESLFSNRCSTPPPIQRMGSDFSSTPSRSSHCEKFIVLDHNRSEWERSFSHTPGSMSFTSSPARSTMSFTSTPMKQHRKRTSLNQSVNRPICEAFTKTGHTCKLHCQEGSNFCHRHQPE